MSTKGTLAAFDAKSQAWEQYYEILKQFFEANGIENGDRQKAILISVVRAQKYKFDSCTRKPEETVIEYVAELRRLAQSCNYGATLEQMLRDRIVCGINDDRIQRLLLAEADLTFDTALKIALSVEAANQNIQDLQKPSSLVCHKVKNSSMPTRSKKEYRPNSGQCYRCKGTYHTAASCRYKNEKCHICGKIGHIARACRNAKPKDHKSQPNGDTAKAASRHKSNKVNVNDPENVFPDSFALGCVTYKFGSLHCSELQKVKPYTVQLNVDGRNVSFELDTGCGLTVMNEACFKATWEETVSPKLEPVQIKLETYTGEPIKVIGAAYVDVTYLHQRKRLPLIVVEGEGPSLLGRGWLEQIKLCWGEIRNVRIKENEEALKATLQGILQRHEEVFKEELGTLKGMTVTIHVKPGSMPKFFRPRSVPFAKRSKVEAEINRLVNENIITPVKYSEWAAPVVPILKPDWSVRLCGDYKLTIYQASPLEQYPIPRLEDLFTTLSGGLSFSKLDMSHAYQQIVMDENSKQYLNINTHKGMFTYNQLPFGVASAPAIFQRTMEGLRRGLTHVAVYLDDILVAGVTEEEHLQTLDVVLTRLQDAGLRLKRNKCEFLQKEVRYLGHLVDAQGLHPLKDKVQAVTEAPCPTNVTELKAYLGLLNYYNKFLPN
ncbi:hypothetical protein M9458_043840, partial [Cirrhinus mrigala]